MNTVFYSKIGYSDFTRQAVVENMDISNTENQRAAFGIKYINK